MGRKNNRKTKKKRSKPVRQITVDTGLAQGRPDLDSPTPSLALASTTSTATQQQITSPTAEPTTPRDRPIRPQISQEEREQMAREFIGEKALGISYNDLNHEGKLRAKRLMSKDFPWSPSHDKHGRRGETTFQEQFELFCDAEPKWQDLSHVYFTADAVDKYLVMRRQRAGICYMHAVTVFQHYLHYIRTLKDGENHEMLDISWYIREFFAREGLKTFLVNGVGGSSITFLCNITGIDYDPVLASSNRMMKKSEDETSFNQELALIRDKFKRCGEPALVSSFAIEEDFKESGKYVYDGEVDVEKFYEYAKNVGKTEPNVKVRHSMVLLGLQEDKDEPGKVWLLLQNFWPNKYLVVVSAEYLASCFATITFVPKGKSVSLKNNLKVIEAHYCETETSPEEEEEQACLEETGA